MAYGAATPWYQFQVLLLTLTARLSGRSSNKKVQRVVLRRKVHRTPLYEFNSNEEKDKPQIEHREKA